MSKAIDEVAKPIFEYLSRFLSGANIAKTKSGTDNTYASTSRTVGRCTAPEGKAQLRRSVAYQSLSFKVDRRTTQDLRRRTGIIPATHSHTRIN
jgi:hypothetical protein